MSSNQAAEKKRGRPQKNIDKVRVLELEKAGKTDQEIAEEMRVSVRKLRSFRKENGIQPATGHGGARRGAGRKSFSGSSYDAYMEHQQAIDARVNSIEAGLRTGKFDLSNDQWLRWAASAFEYDQGLGQYTSKAGCGIPAVINYYKGVN